MFVRASDGSPRRGFLADLRIPFYDLRYGQVRGHPGVYTFGVSALDFEHSEKVGLGWANLQDFVDREDAGVDADGNGQMDGYAPSTTPLEAEYALPNDAETAAIDLCVGDLSGSMSERYGLHVGLFHLTMSSPGGAITTSGRVFRGEAYENSYIESLSDDDEDGDYVAKVGGSALVIKDPEGYLGHHDDTGFNSGRRRFDVYVPKVDVVGHRPGRWSEPGGRISHVHEDDPMRLIVKVNDDNDDGGPEGHRDNGDTSMGPNDDDLVKITLKQFLPEELEEGRLVLSVSPSHAVRVFQANGAVLDDYEVDLARPFGDLANVTDFDVDLYLEALEPSADIQVRLAYHAAAGVEVCHDAVHLAAISVELESDVAFAGTFQIHATTPLMAFRNPQPFQGGPASIDDPCSTDSPTLLIFRDAVSDPNWGVQPFHVLLKVLPDNLEGVQWGEHDPPIYKGSLIDAGRAIATYSDLTVGGLFQFDATVENITTRVNLLLPFAGADISVWFDEQCWTMKAWAESHKRDAEDDNASWVPFQTRYDVYQTWTRISAEAFDYWMDPVDPEEHSPCRRFQSPIRYGGAYGYLTMRGQVVHGSKINNFFWALFGRYWGWSADELRAGAHLNQLGRNLRLGEGPLLDSQSSQNAITLADLIHFHHVFLNPRQSASSLLEGTLRNLWDPNELYEEKLWPSPFLLDPGKSRMKRPLSLPTTP